MVVKTLCPTFDEVFEEGIGAYSHKNDGCNHLKHKLGISGAGQGTTNSFKFSVGEIVEL